MWDTAQSNQLHLSHDLPYPGCVCPGAQPKGRPCPSSPKARSDTRSAPSRRNHVDPGNSPGSSSCWSPCRSQIAPMGDAPTVGALRYSSFGVTSRRCHRPVATTSSIRQSRTITGITRMIARNSARSSGSRLRTFGVACVSQAKLEYRPCCWHCVGSASSRPPRTDWRRVRRGWSPVWCSPHELGRPSTGRMCGVTSGGR
jgi:hypothetical protein